jgi:3-oxoacyl-[acyl-carrier protein] reductase
MITLNFENQVILVTGASRGIGKQIALDFLDCGAKLIVTATHENKKAALINQLGSDICFIPVDFSSITSTQNFLKKITEVEKIDVCINNAGLSRHQPIEKITIEDWNITHDVNLKAPFLLIQAMATIMKKHHYGRIINISSIWGHITTSERMAYASTKFGLRGLTISAAAELAQHNILVNAVSPGITLTDMVKKNFSAEKLQSLATSIPLGRLAEKTEISTLVLFLSSNLNTYITGQCIIIDGGYSIL